MRPAAGFGKRRDFGTGTRGWKPRSLAAKDGRRYIGARFQFPPGGFFQGVLGLGLLGGPLGLLHGLFAGGGDVFRSGTLEDFFGALGFVRGLGMNGQENPAFANFG